jgi:hypothetical protein
MLRALAGETLFFRRDTDCTLNRFERLTAGTRTRKGFLVLSVVGAMKILSLLAAPAVAQRVQFPTPAQSVQATSPYAPPPNFAPAPAAVAPYPSTPFAPSPYVAPAVPYSPAAVGPPPAFDPYATGNSIAPPPALPYSYNPPPPVPLSQQPPPLLPEGMPPPYQPAPYDVITSNEGYWNKTQRFLQELSFEYTLIYGKQSDPSDFGVNRVELSSTFAFPMFYNIETPLLVTPGFAFNFFDGPVSGPPIGAPPTAGGPDLPAQVYDAYLDFAWYPRCYEWLGGELGFRTGVWSDFHNVNSDSIRLLGRALASVSTTPNLDILFGAVYLDRVDVKLLPAGGVYYRPTPEWDMYLVFPNPKVRKYLTTIGNTKWFGFGAGEYGGGSWTVQRQTTDDRIDYNDIRFSGGFEWETQTFIRGHLEVGYVWDREIVFVSGDPPSFTPDDTFMIRAGVDF